MNEKLLLQTLIGEFRDKLISLQNYTARKTDFPKIADKIKVVVGMRRVGKTYFIFQHILSLLKNKISSSRILYINFEDDRLFPFTQDKLSKLIEVFYELYPENHQQKCYLFLDEIQNVSNWPIVLRRFYDSKNVEIFLTGSSAKLLSKEIATSLRGRSLSIEMWPFSFQEFMQAKHAQIDQALFDKKTRDKLMQQFNQYLTEGGFPETTSYSISDRQKTLQEYLEVVIYRDIVERYEIKHSIIIKYMILSMIHNVGKSFSINKFYNDLKSQNYKVTKDSLYKYIEYIEDAYFAFSVPLYDKSIRKIQTNPKKIYAIDPGMIRALTLNYENDLGKLFENVIYLDLRRQGYKIYYYLTAERYEVDFLIQNSQGQKKLIQVVWDMTDLKTLTREERALKAAQKELKIDSKIITLESYLQEGIGF